MAESWAEEPATEKLPLPPAASALSAVASNAPDFSPTVKMRTPAAWAALWTAAVVATLPVSAPSDRSTIAPPAM